MRTFLIFLMPIFLFQSGRSYAQVSVKTERNRNSAWFQFESIPLPAIDDAAANATWRIVRGKADANSASSAVLSDGKIPSSDDQPQDNFFFAAGSQDGCLAVDLGRTIPIVEVATYSWHSSTRAAQVFTLYGADDSNPNFVWNELAKGDSPIQSGWTMIAQVDSRSERNSGGQHASLISDTSGSLGSYRYLLFEVRPTESDDPFGHTFFSEIDVLDRGSAPVRRIALPEVQILEFASANRQYHYHYTIDVTAAPELAEWSEQVLKPVILEWYPRIVALLPSEGFVEPATVHFRYLPDSVMRGVPAYAQGAVISMNANWFLREKHREAAGAVVHEMVHVVQSYSSQRGRNQRRTQVPGWIVEGIPDYIRWFLYEPQTGGAKLSPESLAKARHDSSYRVSANFIDWVVRNHDPQGTLIKELNAAAREGRYNSSVWETLTGKSESQLANDWRNQ